MQDNKTVRCPICNHESRSQYKMKADNDLVVNWHHCYCGSIYHTLGIDKEYFNHEYRDRWSEMKEIKDRFDYLIRVYVNLFEDMTYGRKFLDVGFTLNHNIKQMQERGWIATGIDIYQNDYITEDFEKFNFNDKFDLIHLGHVLESCEFPKKALAKAFSLTDEMGIVLVTTPCPELFFRTGLLEFGHFNLYKEKHIFMSKNEMNKIAQLCGFDLVLYRRNESKRFATWNDHHLIFQRRSKY